MGLKRVGNSVRSKSYARNTRKLWITTNTGRGRTNWKFHDMLNELLGNRPATRPPLVLDTANDTMVVQGNDELSDGCDDAVESENVEDNSTSTVAAV